MQTSPSLIELAVSGQYHSDFVIIFVNPSLTVIFVIKAPFMRYYFKMGLDKCRENILSRVDHYLQNDVALADLRYYSATYEKKIKAIKSSPPSRGGRRGGGIQPEGVTLTMCCLRP